MFIKHKSLSYIYVPPTNVLLVPRCCSYRGRCRSSAASRQSTLQQRLARQSFSLILDTGSWAGFPVPAAPLPLDAALIAGRELKVLYQFSPSCRRGTARCSLPSGSLTRGERHDMGVRYGFFWFPRPSSNSLQCNIANFVFQFLTFLRLLSTSR